VLQPITVRVQPPLSGDNDSVDNVVKVGSTVPTKVQLFACGSNVTTRAAVTVKLAVTSVSSGGASTTTTVTSTTTSAADTSGVMVLDGSNYRYNLSTKGFAVTAGVPAFYQESVSVAYKSAPSVVVGTDAIELDTK
jgi:type 1 fimbria pilin